jgi:hypothetical protein
MRQSSESSRDFSTRIQRATRLGFVNNDTIVGMVAADATEVHVAGFLRTLLTATSPSRDSTAIRATAIAVWHIAKAALVRDFAERVLRGEVPVNKPTPDSLSHWLAERLLTPEQLADFEDESAR